MVEEKTFTTRLNTQSVGDELKGKFQRVELFYCGELTIVETEKLPFRIGRDERSCDLIIQGDTISREHCLLQLRDNQIGLLDTSTNGTHVKLGRSDSVLIHKDHYPLVGQGMIKLGGHIEHNDTDVIFFKVVSSSEL